MKKQTIRVHVGGKTLLRVNSKGDKSSAKASMTEGSKIKIVGERK